MSVNFLAEANRVNDILEHVGKFCDDEGYDYIADLSEQQLRVLANELSIDQSELEEILGAYI